jgi:phage shock protein C
MRNTHATGWFVDKSNRKLAGVCAGLASFYHQPRWLIRLLALLLLFTLPGITLFAYIAAAVILPTKYRF